MGDENKSEAIRLLLDEDSEIKPARAKAILADRGITISSDLFRIVRAAWRRQQAVMAEERRRAEQSRIEWEERVRRDREDSRRVAEEELLGLARWLSGRAPECERPVYPSMDLKFSLALDSEAEWVRFREELLGGFRSHRSRFEVPRFENMLKAGMYPDLDGRILEALASEEGWIRLREDLISGRPRT